MENKFFLVQIKRTSGTYEKGVVVKDTFDAAAQSFHAYFGAYSYGNNPNTDYVSCAIMTMEGAVVKSEVWNNIQTEEQTNE